MSSAIVNLQAPERPWIPRLSPITIGKDVLELLSTSMYVDPMTLYREYIQNAADAIDEARAQGIIQPGTPGRVEVTFDSEKRTVRIRDNGTGIPGDDFERRLSAFGASGKRGTKARGFRGVGRLAGIGYCQELIFRSRFVGEKDAHEMKWDCRKVKSALRNDNDLSLQEVVSACMRTRSITGHQLPEHFFEVEMIGIIRHRNDTLLSPVAVYDYLSQVAPVPFSPEFTLGKQIRAALSGAIDDSHLQIMVSGITEPIFRPHRDRLIASDSRNEIRFSEVETFRVPSTDGGDAALGWILHHEYKGTLPFPLLRGLRIRTGNIQVGGSDLMQAAFQETRFNAWTVGEVHTLDPRLVPNGRRDHFEQNVHFDNLLNHISVVARTIGSRCRVSSSQRNWLRTFNQHQLRIENYLKVLEQGSLGYDSAKLIEAEITCEFGELRKTAAKEILNSDTRHELEQRVAELTTRVNRLVRTPKVNKKLKNLSSVKRHVYEHAFALVYKHLDDHASAHRLVQSMLMDLPTS